jgi:DNA relaxase NicK
MSILSRNVEVKHLDEEFSSFRQSAQPVAVLAPVDPPPTNRGGPVDNFGPFSDQRTKLDWFGFTVVRDFRDLEAWCQCVFPGCEVTANPKGIKGYPESAAICLNGAHLGSIGHGCKHGRNMVNITGEGCKRIRVTDYGFLIDATKCLDEGINDAPLNVKDRVKLIRLDLALDFYRGEVTWDDAHQAFDDGAFDVDTPFGAITPVKGVISSSKDGVNRGRTLNVGLRSAAIMARVYEKGLEVFAKMPDTYKATVPNPEDAVFGDDQFAVPDTVALDWLRVEVEFKPKDELVLDWDFITHRDEVFASAFPFCCQVLQRHQTQRPIRVRSEAVVSLDRTVRALRNSYGNTIHTLRQLGLTALDIVNLLDSGIPNSKLVRAGVADAVKEDPEWLSRIVGQDRDIPFDTPF